MLILFSISVFAGAGYMAWAFTPIGKRTLARWLLKKWAAMASRQKRTIDSSYLKQELKKLTYSDHELLARYTYLDPFGQFQDGHMKQKMRDKVKKILTKIRNAGVLQRADLHSLENIVLPG